MCVQMLGCWLFLALSAHCDYYHTVSAMSPTTDKPTCWTLACSLPLEAPKADLSQDWLSMTSLSFFVGIRLPLPVPLASNHPSTAREWKCSSHTRGKIWAAITHCSYLEKSQKASLLLVVSFLTCCPTPPPPTPCLSSPLRGRRHLCKGELLFFHFKVFTKHRPAPPARPTHPFSTLSLSTRSLCLSFTPLHLCNLPLTALPAFSASLFFLVPSPVCLSVFLWQDCWQHRISRWNGLRSQNPGTSLMGGLPRLSAAAAAASGHQLRSIIWRSHIWPGLVQLGLVARSVRSLRKWPSSFSSDKIECWSDKIYWLIQRGIKRNEWMSGFLTS